MIKLQEYIFVIGFFVLWSVHDGEVVPYMEKWILGTWGQQIQDLFLKFLFTGKKFVLVAR
jgi:hypothetical protein